MGLKNKDSFDKIERCANEIIYSEESILSKTRSFRVLFERRLKRMFDIPLEDYYPLGWLIGELRNHPEAFKKKLQPRARKLNDFFNNWAHANEEILGDNEYHKHIKLLLDFISIVEEREIKIKDEKERLPEGIPPVKKTREMHEGYGSNQLKIQRKNFILSKNLYGKNHIIYFENVYGEKCQYDHDLVLNQLGNRITNLPCWKKYGCYTNSRKFPKFVINLEGVKVSHN